MKALQTSGLIHPTTQWQFLTNTVVKAARLISNNFIYSVFCLYGIDITRLSCSLKPVAPTVFISRLQIKKSHHSIGKFQNGRELEIPDFYNQFPSNRLKANISLSKTSVPNLFFIMLYNEPTNAQLFHKLSHCYMFRHYRVILRQLVINTLPSYTSISKAAVGNTVYN